MKMHLQTSFKDCDFSGANFKSTDFYDSPFENYNFKGCKFGLGSILGTTFKNCNFENVNFKNTFRGKETVFDKDCNMFGTSFDAVRKMFGEEIPTADDDSKSFWSTITAWFQKK